MRIAASLACGSERDAEPAGRLGCRERRGDHAERPAVADDDDRVGALDEVRPGIEHASLEVGRRLATGPVDEAAVRDVRGELRKAAFEARPRETLGLAEVGLAPPVIDLDRATDRTGDSRGGLPC